MRDFDVVIPENNEESMIDMALKLGYDEIVFLTAKNDYKYKSDRIKIKTAFLLKNSSQISFARKRFDYVFAQAERRHFEEKIDFIIHSEHSEFRDSFHYRKTNLNQVHAKLAKEKGINIVFGFDSLLAFDKKTRMVSLGRMQQNAMIANKYKLNTSTYSLARIPSEIRSRVILDSLSRVLNL